MPDDSDSDKNQSIGRIIKFPQSCVLLAGSKTPFKELGLSALSKSLGKRRAERLDIGAAAAEGFGTDICLSDLPGRRDTITANKPVRSSSYARLAMLAAEPPPKKPRAMIGLHHCHLGDTYASRDHHHR